MATQDDAAALAGIHVAALPRDLLPRLGEPFLRRCFYPVVLTFDRALTLVATKREQPCSFVVLAYDAEALTSAVLSRRLAVAGHVLRAVLRNVSLVSELGAHLKGHATKLYPHAPPIDSVPEIYVMATAPEYRSQGIGGELIEAGVARLAQQGLGCMTRTASARAKAFYLTHGFREIGREHRNARTLDILLRTP